MKELNISEPWKNIINMMRESKSKQLKNIALEVDSFMLSKEYRAKNLVRFIGEENSKIDPNGKTKKFFQTLIFDGGSQSKRLRLFSTGLEDNTYFDTTQLFIIENQGVLILKTENEPKEVFTFRIKNGKITNFKTTGIRELEPREDCGANNFNPLIFK